MKTLSRVFSICFLVILFAAFFGCRSVPYTDERAADRVFIISGDTMSDGDLNYRRLPKDWRFEGDYPYQIGTVQGGSALYASDETGTVVKQKKPLLADMDYVSYVRSDIDLESMSEADCSLIAEIYHVGELTLSEQAKTEFLEWYHAYRNGKSVSYTVYHGISRSKIWFSYPSFNGLQYKGQFIIVCEADAISIIDIDGNVLGSFAPVTALYREISDNS